ncbi:MAG TPA: hypothetical protein VGM16_09850, partial [Gammaproteobacteria bacterium]
MSLSLLAPAALADAPPQFDLPAAAVTDPAALDAAMPKLATQVLAVYKEADQDEYLDNLFRLQIVAGQYAEALKTLSVLRQRREAEGTLLSKAIDVQFEIYSAAKAAQT